jgi:hypothetical protein
MTTVLSEFQSNPEPVGGARWPRHSKRSERQGEELESSIRERRDTQPWRSGTWSSGLMTMVNYEQNV